MNDLLDQGDRLVEHTSDLEDRCGRAAGGITRPGWPPFTGAGHSRELATSTPGAIPAPATGHRSA
ncbi:MAG: hypothetical protein ACYDCB_09130 [Candidatus Dormibacteria bacterium]